MCFTASSEKVPSSMRIMCGFTSSCACAMYHPDLCSRFIHSVISNDSCSGQRRPWSDCADAQADLGLRCLHVPEDTFFHEAVHIRMFMDSRYNCTYAGFFFSLSLLIDYTRCDPILGLTSSMPNKPFFLTNIRLHVYNLSNIKTDKFLW